MSKKEPKKEVAKTDEKTEPKAIAVKEPTALATYDGLMDDTPVASTDLVIPKLLLMQGLSELVSQEKAKLGEIRDSIDGNLFGNKELPLEIIPFKTFKTWVLYEEMNGKFEYKGQIPMTPENENWSWDDTVNGVKVRRDACINYFCLVPKEIEHEMFFPYLVSFRRTSYFAGKKLETHRAKLRLFKKPISFKTFLLSSTRQENDKGTYYVYDIKEGRHTAEKELEAVKQWCDTMSKQSVRVDDSDFRKEADHHVARESDGPREY